MSTAEKAAADFDAVADYSALAVLANPRDRLDCAHKAVERLPRSRHKRLKSFEIWTE